MAGTVTRLIIRRRSTGDQIGDDITRIIDPDDPAASAELDKILIDALRRDGWDTGRVGEFEIDARPAEGRWFTHPPEKAR